MVGQKYINPAEMSHPTNQNQGHSSNEPNRLIHTNSPYLQQHAYNPVDWQPWCDEAWKEAKSKNKLVLVSIGYSTCHWCHVMEHECFEDFETAEIMNLHMVNIKVDREERPDIDMIYMDACQLMTGRGGWPLNVICLPNMQPIYAGTYFPKTQWQQIILQLADVYQNDPEKAVEYAGRIQQKLEEMNALNNLQSTNDLANNGAAAVVNRKELLELFNTLADSLDWTEGGVNRTPKFPLPGQYEFVLDHQLLTHQEAPKDFLHLSLLKMCNGGIYDTLRGGFCRYSTDAFWFAPHFEKMLYDNAQLVSLYARAFAWSNAPIYKTIAEECLGFIDREMRLKETSGGFGSALDADSEGMEGKFYVFTEEELITLLSEDDMNLARVQFGIKMEGNWEHGFNILHQALAPLQVIESLNISAQQYVEGLARIKSTLKKFQDSRPRPGFDDKAICSWNALHIKALADAGLYLQGENYVQSAAIAADWTWNTFWQNNELLRIHRQGKTQIQGFLEDYTYLADAFISVYRVSKDSKFLSRAEMLIQRALELFYDPTTHQLAFTPSNGESLILRKSDLNDDVTPSPNAVMAMCLVQLSHYNNSAEYIKTASTLLSQVAMKLKQNPGWYFHWCRVAQALELGGCHIAFSDNPEDSWSKAEVLELIKQLPSWTTVEYRVTDKPKHIQVCAGSQCMPEVDTIVNALEIATDLCSLAGEF